VSIKVMSMIFEAEGLTSTEKLVALALADHASDDGRNVYPGYSRIAHKTSLNKSTIGATINSLVEKGWLCREKRSTPTKPAKFYFNVRCLSGGTGRPEQQGGVVVHDAQGGGRSQHKPSLTIIETSGENSDDELDLEIVKAQNEELRRKTAPLRAKA